jgi:hypothetical protein
VRFAIGVGAWCLLGCSGGVLDIGSSDAGDPREASPEVSPPITEFSAAAVEKARELCALAKPKDSGWTSYDQSALRANLTGGWLLCHYLSSVPADVRSFEFTADDHFYTLGDDGAGGLARVSLGDAAAPIGSQGTYAFLATDQKPSVPGGLAVYVAGNGMPWFHPEFTIRVRSGAPDRSAFGALIPPLRNGAGYLMTMYFRTDGSQDTCVRIDP